MLDSPNYFKDKDPQGFLDQLEATPKNLLNNQPVLRARFKKSSQIIVLVATAEAEIAARLWRMIMKDLPIFICSPAHLLYHLDASTLVILLGSDKKLIKNELLTQIQQTKANLFAISHADETKETDHLKTPSVTLKPEQVLLFFQALFAVGAEVGNLSNAELEAAWSHLEKLAQKWGKNNLSKPDNLAKKLAYEVIGKTPLIYVEPSFYGLARQWKFNFNSISQQLAWTGVYTPQNQSEMTAWRHQVFDKNYLIFYLYPQSSNQKDEFQKMSKSLSGKMPVAYFIEGIGSNYLEETLSMVMLSSFIALYVALLNDVHL